MFLQIKIVKKFIIYCLLAASCFAADPVKIPTLGDYKEVEFIKIDFLKNCDILNHEDKPNIQKSSQNYH